MAPEEIREARSNFTGWTPRRLAPWVVGIALIVVTGFQFGLIPGMQMVHLANWSGVAGWSECALDQGDLIVRSCSQMGYPGSAYAFEAMVPKTLAMWVAVTTGVNAFFAYQAIGIVLITMGVVGIVGLTRLLTRRIWPGFVAAAAYLLAPGVQSNPGLPKTGFGNFLLPVILWAGIEVFLWAANRRRRQAVFAIFVFTTGIVLINVWGYAFLYYTFMLCSVLFGWVTYSIVKEGKWRLSGLIAASIIGFAAVAVVQLALWPNEATRGAPIEFIRGTSVDLMGLLIPSESNSFWAVLGMTNEQLGVPGRLFIGGAPFLGLFSAVLFVVAATRLGRQWNGLGSLGQNSDARGLMIGLTMVTIATVIMILGPSLRFNDPWPADSQALTFSNIQMPEEEATFSFPWDDLYETRALRLARVVWRWQIPMRLVLSIGAAAGIAIIVQKSRGRRWALVINSVLVLFVLSEVINVNSLDDGLDYWGRQATINQFKSDVLEPYDLHLEDGSRVLYLPSANDYLATAAGPLADVVTFNVAGDKNRLLARQEYSDLVRRIIRSYGTDGFDGALLRRLLLEGQVDAVVLNFWHLRHSSYRWPPSAAGYSRWKTTASSAVERIVDNCTVAELEYGYIVSSCP